MLESVAGSHEVLYAGLMDPDFDTFNITLNYLGLGEAEAERRYLREAKLVLLLLWI